MAFDTQNLGLTQKKIRHKNCH